MHENRQPSGVSNISIEFYQDDRDGRDMIKIYTRDSKDYICRRVEERDLHRWPEDWARYEAARGQAALDGTPVHTIPMFDAAITTALRFKGVRTVEKLADLDDLAARSLDIERGTSWRDAARLFMLARNAASQPARATKEAKAA